MEKEIHNRPHFPNSNNYQGLVIKENYISSSVSVTNTHLYEQPHSPKLYTQLIAKDRQKSFIYNIIVLSSFNINLAHFCFPYLTNKCGLGLTITVLLLSGAFSYFVLTALIRYITHTRTSQSNYASIIEDNFGSFCAGLLEIMVIIWYGLTLLISLRTCN